MKFKISILFLMLVLLGTSISFSQNLEIHQWKDQVLLILSENPSMRKQQIDRLQKEYVGLKERKLVVYQIDFKQYFKGIQNESDPSTPSKYHQLKKTKKPFEIILIGLDGGVKLRQTKILSTEKLFTLIDGMPMRRQELKN